MVFSSDSIKLPLLIKIFDWVLLLLKYLLKNKISCQCISASEADKISTPVTNIRIHGLRYSYTVNPVSTFTSHGLSQTGELYNSFCAFSFVSSCKRKQKTEY